MDSKHVEMNPLTTVWGSEPRPGEMTYTHRGGKRVQYRPTIDHLRNPTLPTSQQHASPLRSRGTANLFQRPTAMSTVHEAITNAASTSVSKNSTKGKVVDGAQISSIHAVSEGDTKAGLAAAAAAAASKATLATDENETTHGKANGGDSCSCLVPEPVKFGMWDGVFARCLLNIFGVIMFLRVPWLIAYAGFWQTLAVMLVSVSITTISSLSLSAICTNGEIKGGGAYYLISRALGPEFGGAIGIMFYIGNAIGVAMYHIGFAETVVAMAGGSGRTIIAEGWDSRLIALIALAIVQIVCVTSIALVVKVQLGLLALLVVSLITFFAGCFMEHPELQGFAGPVGSASSRFQDNLYPDYQREQVYAGNVTCPHPIDPVNKPGNWTAISSLADLDGTVNFGVALGIFFPAVTGIMAGANISGDLKDPSSAIPFGTNLSIAVSTVVYIMLSVFVALVSVRSVPGIITGDDCPFGGTFHDYIIMARIAAWPPIVYAGIFASTISSGIASLVGAPRILQAVAADKIFPGTGWLAKTFGPNEEPIAGYVFTCAIAVFSIIALDLNTVAPLITNFFMCSYALTNFACFMADLSRSPGWRPTFIWYNRWLSLLGAILCIAFMLFLNMAMGFASLLVGAGLYLVVWKISPDVNWGSAAEGYKYVLAHRSVLELARSHKEHVKNFRPSPLVLVPFSMVEEKSAATEEISITPNTSVLHRQTNRQSIIKDEDGIPVAMVENVDLARQIRASQSSDTKSLFLLAKDLKKGHGLSIIGHILETERELLLEDENDEKVGDDRGFPSPDKTTTDIETEEEEEILKPKIFRSDSFDGVNDEIKISIERRTSFSSQRKPYENIYVGKQICERQIQRLLDLLGVQAFPSVVRAPSVYDGATSLMQIGGLGKLKTNTLVMGFPEKWYMSSNRQNADFVSILGDAFDNGYGVVLLRSKGNDYAAARDEEEAPLDVWWNADDGGLTLLLPHLIQRSAAWRRQRSTMRVVSTLRPEDLATSAAEIARIKKLVVKFRIGADVKHVVLDDLDSPGKSHWNKFVKRHAGRSSESRMTEYEEKIAKERVRMGEIIAKESKHSRMCVVTMPVPRRDKQKNARYVRFYLATLDALSAAYESCPVLLVHGNQEDALTWYT